LEGTNFSSGMDMALLASAIETLVTHLGGMVQKGQEMPGDVGYGFFNELIQHLQIESENILATETNTLPNDKTAILPPRQTQPIQVSLTSQLLDEFVRVTAVMKWRKAHYHVVYSENNPDNSIGDPVYITGREIAGEDFSIAIAMLETLLPFFDRQSRGELEAATTYADIPVKPAPITPANPVPPRISNDLLSDIMGFASIMRWRKSAYHVRYQGDDGHGNPIHEYPEHPGGFSSGVDTLLLASMLETLGMHLGGDVILPQQMPDDTAYDYFYNTIDRLHRIPSDEVFAEIPTISAKPTGSSISQTELLTVASSIRNLLPTRTDHNDIELVSMAIQIKPQLEKYLALIQPLLQERG
ncbi:MAG TPA: hypothetical protein VJZ27_14185, partial [Aggregatilineales bacterium]|nr:hypothetical protein [Aggregatilineales bacterium]